MARQRTPTNVLERAGAFRKDPQRRRPNEPVVDAAFPKVPPKRLPKDIAKAWRAVVSAAPQGVLRGSDVFIVEQTAILLADMWDKGIDFEPARHAQLRIALGSIGLTPADRSKLSVDKPPKNPFPDA